MNIVIAIIIFSVIIIIHELGHFLLAKKNGITVTEFSIGLGPRLCSFLKNGTRYSLKLLPFGGSCMMLGEDELIQEEGAFNKKPVWARISVIAAGPVFNFILAFALALFIIGCMGYDPAEITKVEQGSAADEAGLLAGDEITKLNGSRVQVGREISTFFQFNGLSGKPITIQYKRNGIKMKTMLTPTRVQNYIMGFGYEESEAAVKASSISKNSPFEAAGIETGDVITKINGVDIPNGIALKKYMQENPLSDKEVTVTYVRDGLEYTKNVTPAIQESYQVGFLYNSARVKASPIEVMKYSVIEVKYWIVTTVKSLGHMIAGKVSMNEVAGPVGIVNIIGDAYEQSKADGILYIFVNLAQLSLLLSANLGVMNLLPIPALDGGRLVFLIIEAVRGKPVNQEKEGLVHAIGLVVLMLLMVFIMFNDIRQLF